MYDYIEDDDKIIVFHNEVYDYEIETEDIPKFLQDVKSRGVLQACEKWRNLNVLLQLLDFGLAL